MDIRAHLKEHHDRLDALFAELMAGTGEPASRRQIFAEFESALVAHLEAEEAHLFPFLEADFSEEIRALREEHELIRREVATLFGAGAAAALDPEPARRFGERLHRHAQREEKMLYTLANDDSASDRYQRLVAYLEQLYARMREDEEDADEGDDG
jgi:hemerythrin-like domain-containing protein